MKKKAGVLLCTVFLFSAGCSSVAGNAAGELMTDYQASEYIELGEYKNLVVKESDIVVPESDIDSQISAILMDYRQAEEITDRGILEGDVVNINNHGYIGDKEVETLKAYNFDLLVGSGDFGKEYEEQLLGVATGETTEFDVSYPADYSSENLAGETVHFVVDVNMIVHYEDQELTDEYVTRLSDSEYTTVEAFREGCAEMLKEENRRDYVLSAAKAKILKDSSVKGYPQMALEQNVAMIKEFYEGGADYLGMTLDDYLEEIGGVDVDSEKSMQDAAEKILEEEMMMKAIAEAEDLVLTKEEYEEYVLEYIKSNALDITAEELEGYFGRNELEDAFLLKKTSEFIYDQVVVE